MVRLDSLLTAAYFGGLLAAFAGVIIISSGNAHPYIDPAQLPFGPPVLIFLFAALILIGAMGTGKLTTRLAKRAASQAGLEPAQGDTEGYLPVFTDIRRGHPVQVRTVTNRDGDSRFTATMVAVILSDRHSAGVVVEPDCAAGIQAVSLGESAAHRDGVAVASDSPEFAQQICDRISPQTVSAPERIGQLFAGNTRAVASTMDRASVLDTHESKIQRALPRDGSGDEINELRDELGALGDIVRDEIDGLGTDAATVVHYTAGPILDSDELQRQVAAVMDVAEAIERTQQPNET